MRKVTVEAQITITINADDDACLSDVMASLSMNSEDDKADVESIDIGTWNITDSR